MSAAERRRVLTIPGGQRVDRTIRTAKTPVIVGPGESWWVTRTSEGPGSLRLVQVNESRMEATAWGPGAEWMLDQAPAVLGGSDDLEAFPRLVAQLPDHLRRKWATEPFRLARTDRVWDAAVGAVLGQKVQTRKATRSRRQLARRFGQPAPGPRPSWILPSAATVAALSYAALHPIGVERARAQRLIRAAREIARSERADHSSTQTIERLGRITGIGPWSMGLIRAVALGDADAVPIGDYHLPNTVAWNLIGEERADDARMLELLEPFAGHRWRVILLAKGAGKAPAHGPRLSLINDGISLAR